MKIVKRIVNKTSADFVAYMLVMHQYEHSILWQTADPNIQYKHREHDALETTIELGLKVQVCTQYWDCLRRWLERRTILLSHGALAHLMSHLLCSKNTAGTFPLYSYYNDKYNELHINASKKCKTLLWKIQANQKAPQRLVFSWKPEVLENHVVLRVEERF